MSKTDENPLAQLGEVRATDTIAFANEPLVERRWEKGPKSAREFSEDGPPSAFGSLLLYELVHPEISDGHAQRTTPIPAARLTRIATLQRELRDALETIARGSDLAAVLKTINSESPFGYQLNTQLHLSTRHVLRTATFYWSYDARGTDRHRVMRALAETLVAVGAARIRLCANVKCGRLLLAKRAAGESLKRRAFCSPECSALYWNETRLASGYFRKKRRESRAGKRKKHTEG